LIGHAAPAVTVAVADVVRIIVVHSSILLCASFYSYMGLFVRFLFVCVLVYFKYKVVKTKQYTYKLQEHFL